MPTEKDYVRKIKEAIKKQWPQAYIFKVHGSVFSAGIPDLVGCVNGLFVGIEVKQPTTMKNVTALQAKNIEWINKAGGLAFVCSDPKEAVAKINDRLNTGGFW
jgi:hypothetical protein